MSTYRWQALEKWIEDRLLAGKTTFTNWDLAFTATRKDTHEATWWIQAYQEAMKKGKTAYVIHRQGQTAASVWHIGHGAEEMVGTTDQFADEVIARISSHLTPIVNVITAKDPTALAKANKIMYDIGKLVAALESLASK